MYFDHLFNDVFREDGTNSRKITTMSLKILEHFYVWLNTDKIGLCYH
jgi:hypothetical protein